jgi:hypothetical protein
MGESMKLTDMEYEWLTGWKGPPGAAYNQVYEFLKEDGLVHFDGTTTPLGYKRIQEYEMEKWNI